ncbi:MAG: hypothetical protein IJO96_08430 [Oscillospiraceae bacterium]|nr:hypothetical protein [Oscillospiraceae bacterium]
MFENAKWIWNSQAAGKDVYCEFLAETNCKKDDKVIIRLSSDSNYALYINGTFANSGQYADMPNYKIYDELDISRHLVEGTNHIAVVVWYYGVESSTYFVAKPGLIFEVEQNGKVVLASDENVLSRKSKRYISGRREYITPQMGLNYHVDLRESDDWMTGKDLSDFTTSFVPEDMPTNLVARIAKKVDILPSASVDIVMQGAFSYVEDETKQEKADSKAHIATSLMEGGAFEYFRVEEKRRDAGYKMLHAALSFFRLEDMADRDKMPLTMVRKNGEGIFFIVDLLKESTGYLTFDIEVPEDCAMEVGWGEHLCDGRCRTAVGPRNFSVTVRLKKGRNRYMNPFRRLGGRYIQFFIHADAARVCEAGIRPTVYPVKAKEFKTGNLLRDTIYEICCNTLLQCMHEHYEDCTWREQSFYTGDSRNQMIAGYYIFGEYDLPKASLRLIAECTREDDLQPLCFPSNIEFTIPSGVPMYARMLAEYYEFSKDKETIEYCFSAIKRNMDAFVRRITDKGLVANFDESEGFWNFSEWEPYMDGAYYRSCGASHKDTYDMCLNASFANGLGYFAKLCDILGEDGSKYLEIKKELNKKIAETFYDEDAKLFRVAVGPGIDIKPYSALANTLGFECGAAEGLDQERIIEIIRDNDCSDPDIEIIPTSLYNSFERMDVLISLDKELYKETVLDQIDRMCMAMIREGATSFWETTVGQKDFDYAGSLCHGWGAMPIIFYEKLCENKA